MNQQEFLIRHPEFIVGMTVRTADGLKVGVVHSLRDRDFIVERGFFFPQDAVVSFDEVSRVRQGEIFLRRTCEELKADRLPTPDERVA